MTKQYNEAPSNPTPTKSLECLYASTGSVTHSFTIVIPDMFSATISSSGA